MTAMATIRNGSPIQNGRSKPPTAPQWLRYMIAAYPAAKAEPATMAVYEDAFLDIEPVVMTQAMKITVREWEWTNRLPSIPFVLERVEAIKAKTTQEPRRVNLTAMRQNLINRAESGDCPDVAEWLELHRMFVANKRANGAAYVCVLVQRYTGQELTHGETQ